MAPVLEGELLPLEDNARSRIERVLCYAHRMSGEWKPPWRLLGSAAVLALWMLLLFTGWALGGAVHLLLLVCLVLFPWKAVRKSS